jgi:hypothetical protein
LRPCFYHHIPYALQVDVQWGLHIPLSWLAFDPSDVAVWHLFCYSFIGVCPFLHGVVRKATKRHTLIYVDTWVATRDIIGRVHD